MGAWLAYPGQIMGNAVFSVRSEVISLQSLKTSTLRSATIPDKEKTLLDFEKQETARNRKKRKNASAPSTEPMLALEGLETQEIATNEKIEEKTSIPVTQPIFLPEIVMEILSWLPVQSLLRLQLVCKQWYALMQDRHFVEKHMSQATVLICWYNVNQLPPAADETFELICGCDGLLLKRSHSSYKYHIHNPTARQILELPDPHEIIYFITLFFVPATGNYKLVSIYNEKEESGSKRCEVLTIGKDDSWRSLQIPKLEDHHKRERVAILSAGATVHCIWESQIRSDIEVLSIDLGTECSTITPSPEVLFPDGNAYWALDWNGKLAFADRVKQNLRVWVLEDYIKHKWGEMVVVPLKLNKDMEGDLLPLFAQYDNLWFRLKGKQIFSYNIVHRRIGHKLSAPGGYKISRKVYQCPPSLVTFEGMKGEDAS
ncbi:unnamed protein product [Ilex paraguariensis]|uniref:F-box domain-containing protein n=1 Tax=Ilex paraguariensis TaxID=185542 RepID=A0ABC8QRV5_9AQUA